MQDLSAHIQSIVSKENVYPNIQNINQLVSEKQKVLEPFANVTVSLDSIRGLTKLEYDRGETYFKEVKPILPKNSTKQRKTPKSLLA